MKIKIGEYEVLETGSLVAIADESVEFNIEGDILKTLRLLFENNEKSKEQEVKAEIPENDKNTVILKFTNFNNPLGIGNGIPLPLGNYKGRPLFFNYRIYSLNDKSGKHIHYTWLLGKEVENGK